MLKGLKKKQGGPIQQDKQYSRVRQQVNAQSIKNAQLMEDELELDLAKQIQQHVQQSSKNIQKQLMQSCLQAFLQGKQQYTQLLQQLKQTTKKQQKPKVVTAPRPTKGKFEYNMIFQDEQDQPIRKSKKRNRPIMASNRIQQYCIYCPDNQELHILSASNYVYLALPKHKTFQQYMHLILAPVDHEQTSIGLSQDTLTQLTNYKKCLIQAFDKHNLQVIFFQQFSKDNSHIYIQCLAIPPARAQDLPFFFRQALQDVQGDWGTHTLIKIQKEKGGLQKQIPKQIKYFYIDFGNGQGFAHVIENQKHWKRDFCYEVLATALNMEIHQIKTTIQFNQEELQAKEKTFNKIWKAYDWTELI